MLNAEVLALLGKLDKLGAAAEGSVGECRGGERLECSAREAGGDEVWRTSVEDAQAMERTAAIVAGGGSSGLEAVVVVSAMAKVTDQLLAAAAAAGRGDRPGRWRLGAAAAAAYRYGCGSLLKAERLLALQQMLDQEFDALDDLLRGIAAVGELTPRTNDLVVSFGERLSSRMVAEAFASSVG